jgi:hypothetical protein
VRSVQGDWLAERFSLNRSQSEFQNHSTNGEGAVFNITSSSQNIHDLLFLTLMTALPKDPSSFRHKALDLEGDEIRLISLQPGGDSQEVACQMLHEKISQEPTYEALSYEWGDSVDIKTLTIDGKPHKVRGNLWAALDHLRRSSKSHRLL